MSTIHAIASYTKGGLAGTQSVQRDWSPYLVHFTNWTAMTPLRSAVTDNRNSEEVSRLLIDADKQSFEVVQKVWNSKKLLARSPSQKDNIPPCVCLSECNIPGLISHAERYGRFGFVFRKSDIYAVGGAPCLYLRHDEYAAISKAFERSTDDAEKRIWGLSNVYCPPGTKGKKVQDFTHEREWRVFQDIDLTATLPQCILAPADYVTKLMGEMPGMALIPIDTLFTWGA